MPIIDEPEFNSEVFHRSMSTDSYIRERLEPCMWDSNYLHLLDLLSWIRSVAVKIDGDVFDYGCGCAPYRRFFSHCHCYIAADIRPGPGVDRLLEENLLTREAEESYDTVLSTQVLEHIKSPIDYLRECHRLLRPGGELLLTTHGMIEEHGCPYDFQRWTSAGLNELISRCGFQVLESGKLTTEIRALVQMMNQLVLHLRYPSNIIVHFVLAVIRKTYVWLGMPALNWLASWFTAQATIPSSNPSTLYVCIFVRARKPPDTEQSASSD